MQIKLFLLAFTASVAMAAPLAVPAGKSIALSTHRSSILTSPGLIEREPAAAAGIIEALDVRQVSKSGRGGHRRREAVADAEPIEVFEIKREPQVSEAGRGGHRAREAAAEAEALETFDARDPQVSKSGRGGHRAREAQVSKSGRGGH